MRSVLTRKESAAVELAALRDEIRELRRAVEDVLTHVGRPARPGTGEAVDALPGEGELVEMIVDDATRIADERDDLARQLAEAKRELAETKRELAETKRQQGKR